MTLQNAYRDREFPVRARWRWRKVVTAARRRRNSLADKTLVFGVAFGAAIVIIAALWGAVQLWGVGALTSSTFESFVQDDNVIGKFAALFLLIALLTMLMSWIIASGDTGLPRREQRRYQRVSHAAPLTARQGQILALDAVSDFGAGGWNRSLEYLPVWKAMPATMQARYEKNPDYQPFLSFGLANVDSLRNFLDQSQSIVSTANAERHIERALGEDSLSLKFVDMLSDPLADEAVQRLASLTGTTEADLRILGEGEASSPAPLLWAADVMLAIGFIRNAYVAEYLDAARSWEHLEQLASVAFATFTSGEEYWANARIGVAFINNSREAVQSFDGTYRDLQSSSWPATHTDFPHDATGQIPDVVRNLRAKSSLPN